MVWRVRLLLAQLDKSPHGCLKNQVSMRGFCFCGLFAGDSKKPAKTPLCHTVKVQHRGVCWTSCFGLRGPFGVERIFGQRMDLAPAYFSTAPKLALVTMRA